MKLRTFILGLIAALGLASPAFAAPRDDVLDAMNKCSAVTDNTARLACYDALKPQLDAALQAPPQTTADSGSTFGLDHLFAAGDKPQTKPEQFGSENLPQQEQAKAYPPAPGQPEIQEIDSVSATVTEYAFNAAGRFIVFLDNGQVWREADSATIHFRSDGNKVTISRGALGSYSLQVNDGNKIYKVIRMK